jgi:hypothetical protein
MAACSSVVKPSGAAQDEMMVNASLKMRGAGPASGRHLTVLNRHSTPNLEHRAQKWVRLCAHTMRHAKELEQRTSPMRPSL